ncbi:MAG: flagellar M-ring protein FliF [Porticoccaceae bacterium]
MASLLRAEAAQGFFRLPVVRQVGLMLGLAASVAVGLAVVLWSREPGYGLLYGNLADKDLAEVVGMLQRDQISYRIDDASGALLVPSSELRTVRMKLAAAGLPKGSDVGLELLQGEQQLGTSQFMEQARYQHAIEVELARSIASLRNVQAARVHLALPKPSVFVRRTDQPSASVVLELRAGSRLDEGEVAAVVHLVAASVPSLNPAQVTVVDQHGRLLTVPAETGELGLSAGQFDQTRKLEETYVRRIESLLAPVVGYGGVRAQVKADIDFTRQEATEENYVPDPVAIRSEQLMEEAGGDGTGGVPGALSNQPPETGRVDPQSQAPAPAQGDRAATAVAAQSAADGAAPAAAQERLRSRQSTRNYELNRTLRHTRDGGGRLRRLSVAVVVDDRLLPDAEGVVRPVPLSDAELARLTALVKDAVGFDEARGDRVSVINQAFVKPDPVAPAAEPLWEQPWVMDLGKLLLAGLALLFLVFGVVRPVLSGLVERGTGPAAPAPAPAPALALPGDAREPEEDRLALSRAPPVPQLGAPAAPARDALERARSAVAEDPARVAQVVKAWVEADG